MRRYLNYGDCELVGYICVSDSDRVSRYFVMTTRYADVTVLSVDEQHVPFRQQFHKARVVASFYRQSVVRRYFLALR